MMAKGPTTTPAMGGAGGTPSADIYKYQSGVEGLTYSVGVLEKKYNKLTGAFLNMPIVKLTTHLGSYAKQISKNTGLATKWHTLSKKQKKEQTEGMPILSKMSVLLMAYTKSGRLANKFVKHHNTLLGRLIGKFFVIFSILMLAALAFAAISIAIDGANSPVVDMTDGVTGLQNVVNGLVIALHGEDGEGGLVGGFFDIGAAAAATFVIVSLIFGPFVGALLAGALLVVGTFNLVKKKTGDTKIALLAAAAVFTLVVGALIVFFTSAGLLAVAAILLPVALILGAGALFWAVITGKAPGWLAWVAGFMVMLALIILLPLAWPFILLAAAVGLGVALIALFLRNKEKVLGVITGLGAKARTWWRTNKSAIIAAVKWTVFFIPTLLYTIVKKIGGHKDKIVDMVVGLADNLRTKKDNFFAAIDRVVRRIAAAPGNIKAKLMAGLQGIGIEIIRWYNANIAGFISGTVPTWVPFIGGNSVFWPDRIDIPALAEGGIVTSPTLAMIGEAGPEAVIPLDKAGGMGGHTFNISIDVSGVTDRSDKRALALEISDHIQREMRRWGRGTTRRAI